MGIVHSHARRFTAFSVIGVAVFLGGEALLYIELLMGMSAFWAYLIMAIVSVEVSFVANWLWVFKRSASWWSACWKFNISRGAVIPLNQIMFVGLLWVGVHLGMSVQSTSLIANILLVGLFTIVNYVIGWNWAFKQRRPAEATVVQSQILERPNQNELPHVAVIIPVRRAQATLRACVSSLLEQDHPPGEIVLVGDVADESWPAVADYLQEGRVTALETVISTDARDANAKRNVGLRYALERGSEVFALTDTDTVLPPGWLRRGAEAIRNGWQCVAGPIESVSTGFWPTYVDRNPLLPKTPRMPHEYVLDAQNFGKMKPPITANAFFTAAVFEQTGGLDPDFVHDYEDYEFFARVVNEGVPILCTHDLVIGHNHREGIARLARDYVASGWGCADFVDWRRSSPMARQRLHQVWMLRMAGILALPSVAMMVIVPYAWLTVLSGTMAIYGALAFHAIIKTRMLSAVAFPAITGVFVAAFVHGFAKGRAFHHSKAHVPTTVKEVATLQNPGRIKVQAIEKPTDETRAPAKRWRMIGPAVRYGLPLAVVAIAAGLRFWQIGARPGWDWDEPVYVNLAGSIASHDILGLKPQYGTSELPWLFHPPFHFLLVGGWFKLVGTGVTQARIWGAAMAIVALVLLYFMLREMIGRKWALVAPALLAVDAWMVYANRVSSIENTLVVFVVLGIWFYWRALQSPTTSRIVVAGALIGLATIYKFTGAYIIVAVGINWLILRKQKVSKPHLKILAVSATVIAGYLGIMTILYWNGGHNFFWMENGVQFQRTLALHGSRGNINNLISMVSPLVHQYRIFIGTILVAVASVGLIGWRLIQSFRLHSWQPVKEHSVLFSWATASVVSFGTIGLKFPTYFQLLLVPMYVYLMAEWSKQFETNPKWRVRALLAGALVGLVVLSGLGFKWRIVDHHDNAMRSATSYAAQYIPRNNVVLTEESIGTMIPQRYCNLYRAGACRTVADYIITYSSRQHPVPMNSVLGQLLAHSTEVKTYTGFKETITIWHILR